MTDCEFGLVVALAKAAVYGDQEEVRAAIMKIVQQVSHVPAQSGELLDVIDPDWRAKKKARDDRKRAALARLLRMRAAKDLGGPGAARRQWDMAWLEAGGEDPRLLGR